MNIEDMPKLVEQNIVLYGVHIQQVTSGSGEPGFTYTIGLAKQDRAEIIAFSLPTQVGHSLLNKLAIGEFKDYEVDTPLKEFATGKMVVKECHRTKFLLRKYLCCVPPEYRDGIKIHQLVWSDPNGHFPWDGGYDHDKFDVPQPCYFHALI